MTVDTPTAVAQPGPGTLALLARPVMERGSALWRFHTALDDLVVLTAVPAAAAVPEPADVADVLTALALDVRQLDPVLGQLADRLTALADSPHAATADADEECPAGCYRVPAPLGGAPLDGDGLCSSCAAAGTVRILAAALTDLAAARHGLTAAARAVAAAGGHARQLVLTDPS